MQDFHVGTVDWRSKGDLIRILFVSEVRFLECDKCPGHDLLIIKTIVSVFAAAISQQ